MKKIPLRNKAGKIIAETLVDDADFPIVSQFHWYRQSVGYACAKKMRNRKSTIYYLHRVIMNPAERTEVDHINGNKLDNRRHNLRIVTHKHNLWNQKLRSTNTSGTNGIYFDKRRNKWNAEIMIHGKKNFLGTFTNKIDAIKARRKADKELFIIEDLSPSRT